MENLGALSQSDRPVMATLSPGISTMTQPEEPLWVDTTLLYSMMKEGDVPPSLSTLEKS